MSAVFSPVPQTTLERVCDVFGVLPLRQARGITGGSVNTIFRLDTEGGIFFLRLEEVKHESDLAMELRYVAKISADGFPTPMPRPLPNSPTKHIAQVFDRLYSLFPEQRGEQADAAVWNKARFESVGSMLARLHAAGAEFKENLHDRFRLEALWQWFQDLKGKLQPADAAFVQLLEDEFTVQQKCATQRRTLPQGVVHGDLFADNVFFEGDRAIGLIDFDAAASRELLYDLATAFNALCFRDGKFDHAGAAALCRGYEKTRPLTNEERRQFIEVWRGSSLRFAVTRIKDYELRLAGTSGREYRDYRDFCRRLGWQRTLDSEAFWKEIKNK